MQYLLNNFGNSKSTIKQYKCVELMVKKNMNVLKMIYSMLYTLEDLKCRILYKIYSNIYVS